MYYKSLLITMEEERLLLQTCLRGELNRQEGLLVCPTGQGVWRSPPRFKTSSLLLDGFVLGGSEFNSSTLCK